MPFLNLTLTQLLKYSDLHLESLLLEIGEEIEGATAMKRSAYLMKLCKARNKVVQVINQRKRAKAHREVAIRRYLEHVAATQATTAH